LAAVLPTLRKAGYAELAVLFFLYGATMSIWLIPLGLVLDAQGYGPLKPYAYAASAVGAFVSPLIFGAMADHHASPVRVLRGLAFATAIAMVLSGIAIQFHWGAWVLFGCVQLCALCAAPTGSIVSSIIFSRLDDAQREFGPVRCTATIGWMSGCWLVSAARADATPFAAYIAAGMSLALAAFTLYLPAVETPKAVANLTLRQRLGLDALTLLRNPDHRVIFIVAALLNLPLAAFFPYAPTHLREVGLKQASAWMSLGQVTEIVAMFSLGALLLKWRLKWIIGLGLSLGVVRYTLSAMNGPLWLLAGIALHGVSFTLVFITAQIYIDQRVAAGWRTRAQALLALMSGGFGNLAGYLGTGWWFSATARSGTANWPVFWGGLAAVAGAVLVYFLIAYHGIGTPPQVREKP
jgi:nucleoside transporter